MRRLLVFICLSLVAGLGGWTLARSVESPTQAAARAQPPESVPVLATVDLGHLYGAVTISVTAGREREISVIRTTPASEVVTAAEATAGETVSHGSVLLRSNGRPVFVLQGQFPFYRDLQGGDAGDDVAQLQLALRASGHATGSDRIGSFGSGTKAALRALYRSAGYTAPENDGSQRSDIAEIDQQLQDDATNPDLLDRRDQLTEQLGPRGAISELVTVAELPAIVESVTPVGTALNPGDSIATLGAGSLVLTASLPTASAAALSLGATGEFVDADGITQAATVTGITPTAQPEESLITMSAAGALGAGTGYLVRIDNPKAESTEQLLVPLAAVVTRGGRSYVYRLSQSHFEQIAVDVVGSTGGTVAIKPTGKPSLAPQDEVRLGSE